jgi:hypothetical protein
VHVELQAPCPQASVAPMHDAAAPHSMSHGAAVGQVTVALMQDWMPLQSISQADAVGHTIIAL